MELPKEYRSNNPFHTILIAVVFDPAKRKILIGKKEKDPDIPSLTWAFPGGRLAYGEDMDKKLKKIVKDKTGYEVKNLGAIFSRVLAPETKDFIGIYFLCEVFKGKAKPGIDLTELRWVDPEDLEKMFTTSFHPRLKEYITNLK